MSDSLRENNPYAAPLSSSAMPGSSDDEVIRKQYLSHEASVKSIGFLYLLGGVFGILAGIFYIVMSISNQVPPDMQQIQGIMIGMGIFFLVISALQLYAAISVRKLETPGRIIVTVFSVIGLAGFPIGTLISAYILYLLWSAKGKFIFTPEYQRVIQATPHIKYKTSIVVWIFLGLVLLLIAFAIGAALLSKT